MLAFECAPTCFAKPQRQLGLFAFVIEARPTRMKNFLHGLKLFAAFFLLFFGLTIARVMPFASSNMPNWATLVMGSCLALGLTILWMDRWKN